MLMATAKKVVKAVKKIVVKKTAKKQEVEHVHVNCIDCGGSGLITPESLCKTCKGSGMN